MHRKAYNGWILLITVFLYTLISCQPKSPKWPTLELLAEGLPFTIKAPQDVNIDVDTIGIIRDITIQNEGDYSVQIFEQEATKLDPAAIIKDIKDEVSQSPYFSKIIEENEVGFVFEKKIDETYTNYDFRHVKVRGDKQYLLQGGMMHTSTLAQAKLMYHSVQ